jgi:adenosylcobyric acid synthase
MTAKTLMVQGTASTVGKSTLVTGLCRLFRQAGWRVAPFKAQNMALNSFVTREGGEMGRAQVTQAEAAGVEPSVYMNPVLLKPEGDSRSQVIVLGRPLDTLSARDYYRNRDKLLQIVTESLQKLRSEYDLVIIEGAGSPVELNLAKQDIVNMRIAQLADAPVLLAGDIDRGGIFASLLGTLQLLSPDDRARVKGLIVNKFRGDISLWRDGEKMLAEMAGIPVLGTVPMFHDIYIAEEDTVPLEEGTTTGLRGVPNANAENNLEIAVIRLPYLSNYDEFDPLFAEPGVNVRFVASPSEFAPTTQLVIIPGTKNTLKDLSWLWRQGLASHIRQLAKSGVPVLGICGGYQMLGQRVTDSEGTESTPGTVEPGLALLPVETYFAPLNDKITEQSRMRLAPGASVGLFASLPRTVYAAYQIHAGRTVASGSDLQPAFVAQNGETDGWLSPDGKIAGCYLHGLFENDAFRHGVLQILRGKSGDNTLPTVFSRDAEYDKLADLLRRSLDVNLLHKILSSDS